jgi:hypothetical protein
MTWKETIMKANWVGFCHACDKWRNQRLSRQEGQYYFCTKPINYRGKQGDAEMYRRENLEGLDGLIWNRRKLFGRDVCGIELTDSDEPTNTDRTTTDFRGRGDIPGV